MLRITIHDEDSSWRLQLEGKLAGAWAAETENAWRGAPVSGKRIEVDLTGVTAVDDRGQRLLEAMHRAGAHFRVEGLAMKALLREIQRTSRSGEWTCKWFSKIGAVGVLLAMAAAVPARAQNTPAPLRLTLQGAVRMALEQNPRVAIANLSLLESAQQRKAARAGLLPQVSLSATDVVTRGNVEAVLGMRIPGFREHIGPFWAMQAGPEFSAPLVDVTLWRKWQAARETVRTSAADANTARELNAQLVVSQYLAGLRAAADVRAAQSRVDLAKALLALAQDLQKNGAGTGIDTLRANVQYQNESQRYTEAQTELQVSLYGLSRLLNLDPRQAIQLTDEPSFFETPEFRADQSLERAYRDRPEMQALASQIRAGELRKRAAEAERLPRLALNGGWTLQGLTPTSMIPAYQYGASLQVPLFTGGRISAEVAEADLELKKLGEEEQDLRNRIAMEVKTAVAQLESARVEVTAANEGVRLAREGVSQAQDRFKAGAANNIEVITAQDELARANDNQITALYRYNQARADLARATGQMEALYAR